MKRALIFGSLFMATTCLAAPRIFHEQTQLVEGKHTVTIQTYETVPEHLFELDILVDGNYVTRIRNIADNYLTYALSKARSGIPSVLAYYEGQDHFGMIDSF